MSSNVRRLFATARRLVPAMTMLALWATASSGASAASPESTQFADDVARSNAALLRASQVAQKTSQDPQVRGLSSRLAAEVADADATLSAATRRIGIESPRPGADAAALPEHTDATFDRVYTLEMSQQLAKLEALLTTAAESNAVDQELQRFAEQRLPSVRESRKRADAAARAQAGVRPTGVRPTG